MFRLKNNEGLRRSKTRSSKKLEIIGDDIKLHDYKISLSPQCWVSRLRLFRAYRSYIRQARLASNQKPSATRNHKPRVFVSLSYGPMLTVEFVRAILGERMTISLRYVQVSSPWKTRETQISAHRWKTFVRKFQHPSQRLFLISRTDHVRDSINRSLKAYWSLSVTVNSFDQFICSTLTFLGVLFMEDDRGKEGHIWACRPSISHTGWAANQIWIHKVVAL